MIYHKFSHGAVSYTLNGGNVNVMLELLFCSILFLCFRSEGVGFGISALSIDNCKTS